MSALLEDDVQDIETWEHNKCLTAWIALTGIAPVIAVFAQSPEL